jgi:hypothetical protein
MVIRLRHGRPIKIAAKNGIFNVAVKLLAISHKKPMLYAMRRKTVYYSFAF